MNVNQMLDPEGLHTVSGLLGRNIPQADPAEIPGEIAETLESARRHMKQIPAALDDLAAARKNFDVLSHTIDRMLTLAREAAGLAEDDRAGREHRDAEFKTLAGIVAELAGRREYGGPDLNLTGRAQARGSYRALKNLLPVKADLAAKLDEQETLIIRAIGGTLNLLETVGRAYPEAVSLAELPDLLRRVGWAREAFAPILEVGQAADMGLH